jgi:uncharacterized membrane protein YozB (DUF420 family)
VVLLLVAPGLVLMGAFAKRPAARFFQAGALILMMVGTTSILTASLRGFAAGRALGQAAAMDVLLAEYRTLSLTSSLAFVLLTTIFALLIYGLRVMRTQRARILSTLLCLVFLVLYAAGVVLLVNTVRYGEQLLPEAPPQATARPFDSSDARVARERFEPSLG